MHRQQLRRIVLLRKNQRQRTSPHILGRRFGQVELLPEPPSHLFGHSCQLLPRTACTYGIQPFGSRAVRLVEIDGHIVVLTCEIAEIEAQHIDAQRPERRHDILLLHLGRAHAQLLLCRNRAETQAGDNGNPHRFSFHD